MEVVLPYVKYRVRRMASKKQDVVDRDSRNLSKVGPRKTELTEAEEAYVLEPYDPVMGTLMDYAELAVQFGYVTLFVVAFPLAPVLALLNNYVETRSDAFKMLSQLRRPVPRGAEDIGSWQGVFTVISCLAVVTNSALVRRREGVAVARLSEGPLQARCVAYKH